ncbi:MAG TPA: hypothetical protein VKI61_13815, partial [Chitinophagaceae bacterium]|nr:hypothetical protein [Chitinophagaceae bacterium]
MVFLFLFSSFSIFNNSAFDGPLLQVDLLPAQQMGFSSLMEYNYRDYSIHYLYQESFRDPNLF